MKPPLTYDGSIRNCAFLDEDCEWVEPADICDAVNNAANAAAGAWETGPVPDGEKEGDKLLFCYQYRFLNNYVGAVWIIKQGYGAWRHSPSGPCAEKPDAFAKLNEFEQRQEAPK